MRHAKSAWNTNAPSDHARPLNKRGKRDAPLIAERMIKLGWIPELVLSSDSVRTQETWQRMRKMFAVQPEVVFTNQLYHGRTDDIQALVSKSPENVQCLLVLGHNPGWESALRYLCGEYHEMTTANAALLSNQGKTWREAISHRDKWKLHNILRPKEL